ncbi:hypothetical protein [Sellimonas intestinalis]|uniref:hypothetical protein n=1 Tax=Sellimonas intestinalis TaxID=1653434 RepID=UPI000E401384|nr:hypothetical protein [Sellimonas intestinalis]RGD36229.1 hypothetical protein DW166_14730 [Sellimonas intestinalis]
MEMLKGVLITFDVILMMIFFGIAVYSVIRAKKKDTATAIVWDRWSYNRFERGFHFSCVV